LVGTTGAAENEIAVSVLDYDLQTLNSRDYSYKNQLADAQREGWEIDPTMHSGDTVYLRRHRRVAEIQQEVTLKRKYLRFARSTDGAWVATFFPPLQGASVSAFSGETPLDAAEAAWAWAESEL
jgi:hypothetical protein